MHLRLLLIEQPYQLVILLNRLQRLDENSLSAGARAMNHAADLAFELRLDGNDKTLATHRDQLVLRAAAV